MRKVKMMRAAAPAAALAAVALVSGCGAFDQSTPDEFRVVSRAPLEVPPDFNLRPPQPGTPRPQELAQENRATATIFGAAQGMTDPNATIYQSQGEVALLVQAGADQADPDIRAVVDRENPGVVLGDRTLLDRLLFWRDGDAQADSSHTGAPPTIARTGTTAP